MKVLIIGSGCREHAIGDSIAKRAGVTLYFAPGNAGTGTLGQNVDIKANDLDALLAFAKKEAIDYTVVGPEDPLCLGIVDRFEAQGLKIFGPTRRAAMLEGSKAFSKEFMIKYGIPTAAYTKTSDKDSASSAAYELLEKTGKAVLKVDGLCQGKGVFIASTKAEADEFLNLVYDHKKIRIKRAGRGGISRRL